MPTVAAETTPLVTFTLPGTPCSAWMARFYVRGTLMYHGLGDFGEDCAAVASELVANAVKHAGAPSVSVDLIRLDGPRVAAVAVAVLDSSPLPPVLREVPVDAEHGRGLHLVTALSAGWSWFPHETGKAVYAILTSKASIDPAAG
jgi:hypothetical protein